MVLKTTDGGLVASWRQPADEGGTVTVKVRITRNVIGGPGLKFKRGDVLDLQHQTAKALLAGGSAVLVDEIDEANEVTTKGADVAEDRLEVDVAPFTKPEIDDDLVVADEPEPKTKGRRKKG